MAFPEAVHLYSDPFQKHATGLSKCVVSSCVYNKFSLQEIHCHNPKPIESSLPTGPSKQTSGLRQKTARARERLHSYINEFVQAVKYLKLLHLEFRPDRSIEKVNPVRRPKGVELLFPMSSMTSKKNVQHVNKLS